MDTARRGSRRARRAVMAVGALTLLLAAGSAQAQLCGDADGNGTVGVTDGVEALRAGAGLPSSCTLEVCDIDRSGAITLTDGVTILRKAAGLPISQNCAAGGFFNSELATILRKTQPLFDTVLPTIVTDDGGPEEEIIPCDNSFEDGELIITRDAEFGETLYEFADCELDRTLFSGELLLMGGGIEVALDVSDPDGDEILSFEGTLIRTILAAGSRFSDALDVFPDLFFDLGDFVVSLRGLEFADDGSLRSGSAFFDFGDAELEGILAAEAFYDGSNLVRVLVTLEDRSTREALFDLNTGQFR